MKIIKSEYTILTYLNGENILKSIESIGRVCYKSEDRIFDDSAVKFVANILKRGHESVIEHFSVSVRFICDRGVSHELIRHRLCSFSQESSRYCNYSQEKFGKELTFIKPLFWEGSSKEYLIWLETMKKCEEAYISLLENGAKPEEARDVLPNSLKTEIIVTANLREWRHLLSLRTSPQSHPQMRELTIPLLNEFKEKIPVVFDDILY